MKLKSLKSKVNNQKNRQIKGKITKSYTTFNENKPNLKNIKIGVSSFETSKYEILSAWRGEKTNPFKPNTNPIPERPKMNLRNAITMNYKDFAPLASKKQTQFKPNTNPIKPKDCFALR